LKITNDTGRFEGVCHAWRADTRIGFDERPIALALSNGDLVMEGEVADVSARWQALRKAAEVITAGVSSTGSMSGPRYAMEDGEIRDLVRDALLAVPASRSVGSAGGWRATCSRFAIQPMQLDTLDIRVEDRFLLTEEELENKMADLLGGRAAERLVFGKVSTDAADDLAKVSDIARNYVA